MSSFITEVLSEFERGALKIKLLGHQDRYRAREKREEPGIDWPAVEAEGRSLGFVKCLCSLYLIITF